MYKFSVEQLDLSSLDRLRDAFPSGDLTRKLEWKLPVGNCLVSITIEGGTDNHDSRLVQYAIDMLEIVKRHTALHEEIKDDPAARAFDKLFEILADEGHRETAEAVLASTFGESVAEFKSRLLRMNQTAQTLREVINSETVGSSSEACKT